MSKKPPEENKPGEETKDQAASSTSKDGVLWGVTGEEKSEDQVASNKSKDGVLWGVTGEEKKSDSNA